MHLFRADMISPLDMFKIGIGPSSSHTVGPMLASSNFRKSVQMISKTLKDKSLSLQVELYGSLSLTGKGHATDSAVCAGLAGHDIKLSSTDDIWNSYSHMEKSGKLILEELDLLFTPSRDIKFCKWSIDNVELPHPNTVRYNLIDNNTNAILLSEIYISIGGGFIEKIDSKSMKREHKEQVLQTDINLDYPYNSAQEFVEICNKSNLKPWEIVLANMAKLGFDENYIRQGLDEILDVFENCIQSGLSKEGILPGGLNVKRRASKLYKNMHEKPFGLEHELKPSIYAIAVNEENASGGRVVTAPTNGSSGLIPGVFKYLQESRNLNRITLQNGLIVASVIGALVKVHASISGAEVGCQGEVGTSCAMAAGGACAMLGGTPEQIEQASEIGIEHHLGMTCDPINGLVQVPCIERNAMGAVKALNAVALSLSSDGSHLVSLDKALKVMKQTGLDMHQKYKETSTGGLAIG